MMPGPGNSLPSQQLPPGFVLQEGFVPQAAVPNSSPMQSEPLAPGCFEPGFVLQGGCVPQAFVTNSSPMQSVAVAPGPFEPGFVLQEGCMPQALPSQAFVPNSSPMQSEPLAPGCFEPGFVLQGGCVPQAFVPNSPMQSETVAAGCFQPELVSQQGCVPQALPSQAFVPNSSPMQSETVAPGCFQPELVFQQGCVPQAFVPMQSETVAPGCFHPELVFQQGCVPQAFVPNSSPMQSETVAPGCFQPGFVLQDGCVPQAFVPNSPMQSETVASGCFQPELVFHEGCVPQAFVPNSPMQSETVAPGCFQPGFVLQDGCVPQAFVPSSPMQSERVAPGCFQPELVFQQGCVPQAFVPDSSPMQSEPLAPGCSEPGFVLQGGCVPQAFVPNSPMQSETVAPGCFQPELVSQQGCVPQALPSQAFVPNSSPMQSETVAPGPFEPGFVLQEGFVPQALPNISPMQSEPLAPGSFEPCPAMSNALQQPDYLSSLRPDTIHSSADTGLMQVQPMKVSSMFACETLATVQPADQAQVQPASSQPADNSQLVKADSVSANPKAKALSIVRHFEDSELEIRPAQVRTQSGFVLAATVDQESKVAEWEWSRAAAAMDLKAEKQGKFFRDNTDHHHSALVEAEISNSQIHYRGWGAAAKGQHTLESSALVLMALLISMTKQHAQNIKANAIKLVVEVLKVAIGAMVCVESFPGIVYGKDNRYHQQTLQFDSTGLLQNLHLLMVMHPGCQWAWNHLMVKGYCAFKITSAFTHPTFWDLMILLAWAKCNPTTRKVWSHFGQFLWPKIMFVSGTILDKLAYIKSCQPLEQLPLLKTRKGKRRLVPWINKIVLLRKMSKVKRHRKHAATSHDDLVPCNAQIVMAEEFLCASLYAKKIREAYQDCFHFSIHWDPSNYDIETLVSIVFSYQAGMEGVAGYLPNQNIKPVTKSEVDPEILALSSLNKLTRVQGYNEIRALSHSLKSINMPLQKFFFPKGLLWNVLQGHESRVFENGEFFITNHRTSEKSPQIPKNFSIQHTPLLASISDQGGINRAGLDFLVHKLGMSMHVQFDPYHRGWNDLKDSLRKSKGDLFKCFLSFALFWNVNYGPFNSKEWHQRKVAKVKDLLTFHSAHSEPFLSFIPYICRERSIEEPTTAEGRELLMQSLASMNSIRALGPVVKIQRWFSWFQSEKYYSGECCANKYIMEGKVDGDCKFVRSEEEKAMAKTTDLSDKQELQQLKAKMGTYSLAPLLITSASMYQKDVIKLIAQPCWSHHSNRSEKCLSPHETSKFIIQKTLGGWIDELYDLIVQGFLTHAVLKELYPHMATSEDTKKHRLEIHFDFACKLVAKRSMSLMAQYCRPPLKYAALLSQDLPTAKNIQKQMQKDWERILQLESRDCKGEFIPGLESLSCIKESICRVAFILNERDLLDNTWHAQAILKTLTISLGDTQCIENTHQSAKDCLRESRHNQRSRVQKFKACLDAKVLQTRKTTHVQVNELELALQSVKTLPAFVPLTHPNTHKLGREFQDLMQFKSSSHWWPSTSAVSQFEEAMCYEALISKKLEVSHLGCLVGDAGSVLVNKQEQLAVMALAKTSSGFTAWILEAVSTTLDLDFGDMQDILFKPVGQKTGFVLKHVTSFEDWLMVPTEPVLHQGALMLKQSGEPSSLLRAKLQQGLDLTVRDVKTILSCKGVHLKGAPSKAQCYEALIKCVAENDEEAAAFLATSSLNMPEEKEGEDAEFNELLELLEEDIENRDDPDIKNEKKKRKKLPTPKVLTQMKTCLHHQRKKAREREEAREKDREQEEREKEREE